MKQTTMTKTIKLKKNSNTKKSKKKTNQEKNLKERKIGTPKKNRKRTAKKSNFSHVRRFPKFSGTRVPGKWMNETPRSPRPGTTEQVAGSWPPRNSNYNWIYHDI